MGIDYRNVIAYGKEFDSFEDAIEELHNLGVITEDEFDDIRCGGEIHSLTNKYVELLEWSEYNAFVGGTGVLGVEFSACQLYEQPSFVKNRVDIVENKLLGHGCGMHQFVKVY